MDMWVKHAMRKQKCVVCPVEIQPGDDVMVGQTKKTYPHGVRTRRTMSHLDCWIRDARYYLHTHPYEPTILPGPGRPKQYDDQQKRERKSLLMNISRWGKKRQEMIELGMWINAAGYARQVSSARDKLNKM